MPNTLILATQRTGSTLLCSEFSGLGGLGRPGEHFLPWLRCRPEDDALDDADFRAICEEGRDATGAVGLKLMADYMPRIAGAMGAGDPQGSPEERCAALVSCIETRIGAVTLFRIDRRDRFAQALSRYLATATGLYFRTTDGDVIRPSEDRAEGLPDQIDMRRLENLLEDIARECAFLDRLEAILDRPILTIAYEDLAEQRERVLPACCHHAGIAQPAIWPRRWMRKVVDPATGAAFRAQAQAHWSARAEAGQDLPDAVRELRSP